MRRTATFLGLIAVILASISIASAGGAGAGTNSKEALPGPLAPYQGPVIKGVDTTTLTGKVMCGYQGWFGAPGDGGTEDHWRHWTKNPGGFVDGNAKVDLWPDVSDLDP